jgi:hypothetical protein
MKDQLKLGMIFEKKNFLYRIWNVNSDTVPINIVQTVVDAVSMSKWHLEKITQVSQ